MITVLLIVLAFLIGLTLFLLFTPIRIELDTSIPIGRIRYGGVGYAEICHEGEWMARLRILFFRKTILLEKLKKEKPEQKKIPVRRKKPKRKKGPGLRQLIHKTVRVLRSFSVEQWQLALDTGDTTLNAKLYPLNWLGPARGHLLVNFTGQNYFKCRIRNSAWRLLKAWYFK